jgi:hypothetical protein
MRDALLYEGQPLFQKVGPTIRGSIEPATIGYLQRFFQTADFDTLLHEDAHLLRFLFGDRWTSDLAKHFEHTVEPQGFAVLTRKGEEQAAEAIRMWQRTRVQPDGRLRGMLDQINVDWGPMLGARDLSDKATTDGGQSYGVRRPVVRTLAVPLSWLTQDEAHALFDRLVLRRGMLAPVLISWDPEDSTEKVLTTFWATLTSAPTMEAISTFFSTGKSARRLAFQFEEYL